MAEQRIDLVQAYLGMKPYVLVEFEDFDEDGGQLSMRMRFGGGVTEEQLPLLLQLCSHSKPYVDADNGTPEQVLTKLLANADNLPAWLQPTILGLDVTPLVNLIVGALREAEILPELPDGE